MLSRLRYGRRLAAAAGGQLEIATLRAGLEAGLFEALAEAPATPAALAEARGLPLDLTAAWLRAAHAHDLLDKEGGSYRPSAYLRWLTGGDDAAMAGADGRPGHTQLHAGARTPARPALGR